jgi:diguanylate cyclase (GGDEF)-like protein
MKMFTVENKYLLWFPAFVILEGIIIFALSLNSHLSGPEQFGIFLFSLLLLTLIGIYFYRRHFTQFQKLLVRQSEVIQDSRQSSKQLETVTRQMKQQIYVLHNLFEISIDLSSILELERLINSYLLALIGQLRTTRAMLLLVEQSEFSELAPVFVKGFSPGDSTGLALTNATAIHRFFQKDPRPLEIANPRLRTVLGKKSELLKQLEFQWVAPMIHNGTLHGIVALGPMLNQTEYSIADIEMFSMMTNFAAVAFSNAQQYQAIEKISVTDGLTGLFNYRYFRSQLKRELERARRCEHYLSLMIIDVDFFKNYNDTVGHLAGDVALQQISKIIQNTARKTDIVARYGGEEFCVILPEVEVRGAKIFGERLRSNIEGYPIPNGDVQPLGRMTVSLGAASFPLDAQLDNQLITHADQALYQAKSNGRNQLRLFSEAIH